MSSRAVTSSSMTRTQSAVGEWRPSDKLVELLACAFDPLQAGNAHFNLHRLGARSHTYFEIMYGLRTDALNAGVPTDRPVLAPYYQDGKRTAAFCELFDDKGFPSAKLREEKQRSFAMSLGMATGDTTDPTHFQANFGLVHEESSYG